LPIQLGKHFWTPASYVLGLRIDYLSPTVYLTDILILAILIWGARKTFSFRGRRRPVWLLLLVFIIINCLLAQNHQAAFYKLFKLVEMVFLGIYFSKSHLSAVDFQLPLSLAIIYSSLIAVAQFFKQSSLGGLFYWLGERSFSVSTPGIAKVVWQGHWLLRSYGTFSHPNALAGFLLVAMILLVGIRPKSRVVNILRWPSFVLGLAAVLASFSRLVWAAGILMILFFIFFQPIKKIKKWLSLVMGVGLMFAFSWNLWQQNSFLKRVELDKVALQMIRAHPLIGVGLNNFIFRLPEFWPKVKVIYWLQPVHNIFLLVAAETGLIGLLIFSGFLFLTLRRLFINKNRPLLAALIAILFTGFFDHYWLTLQQPQLLLTILLGFCWVDTGDVLK